jgi:predicted transcriptional regulator
MATTMTLSLKNNQWQTLEIKAALKEANAGDFARGVEVAALAKKWNPTLVGRSPMALKRRS